MTENNPTDVDQSHEPITWSFREVIHAAEKYRDSLAKALEVNPSELVALGHIHKDGPITPNVLATRLDFTTGSVTALVDRLENAGMVQRKPNPDDRRSILIEATDRGAKAMDEVYTDLDKAMNEATRDLNREDVARISTAMEQISVRLVQHTDAAQQQL